MVLYGYGEARGKTKRQINGEWFMMPYSLLSLISYPLTINHQPLTINPFPFPLAFFNISPSPFELIVVFIALLLLFGAKKLPQIARNLGRSMEEFRRAAKDVTDEIMHSGLNDNESKREQEPERILPGKNLEDKTVTRTTAEFSRRVDTAPAAAEHPPAPKDQDGDDARV